ncbi:hypothetical protein EJB05_22405, partial [Eragrostis curvula]
MEPISTISLIILFLTSLLILKLKSRAKCRTRRPPGPSGLPLVGSIHHLLLTSQPHAAFRDLAAKHGPVMYLRLGQTDTVVVSSAAAAQEVLQAKDISFASRPSLLGPEIVCYGGMDLAFAPYGPYWRALRKVAVLELLSARKVRQFAPIREGETMSLIRELRAAAAGGEPVNLGRLLASCTNSITGLATFGYRCGGERREQFLSAMAAVLSNSLGFCVSDLFPSLGFLDIVTGTLSQLRRGSKQLDDVLDKIISGARGAAEQ